MPHANSRLDYSNEGCSLLGDTFGVVLQMALGLLAFSILTVKYLRERETRDFLDWSMDTGKQAVGSSLAHGWNIVFASALTNHYGSSGRDPCVYYLMNFCVDTLLGCFGNYLLLRAVEVIGGSCGKESLRATGRYDDGRGRKNMARFWLQLLVWLWIITVVKVVLLFVVIIPLQKRLYKLSELLLSPFSPRMELCVVMVVIPVTCNAFVFWITDSFLKKKE